MISANIDQLIESYDVQDDPVLQEYFRPIEDRLWQQIENYGAGINHYGDTLAKHLVRTSAIGRQFLTAELGFSDHAGRNFYDANLFQDLGKTHPSYDINIWSLPHRPTEEERLEKKKHPLHGTEMIDEAIKDCPQELKDHPHIKVIKAIQLYHHEKINGEGLNGLKGDDLGKVIKAICIIDAFDGDMIHRPHQLEQRDQEAALARLKTGKKYEDAFDPSMLQRFIDFQLIDS